MSRREFVGLIGGAMALRPGQLRIKQRNQLSLRALPAHMFVGPLLLHKPIKPMPGQVLQHPVQYAILVQHGVACSRQNVKTQKNPCHAPRPLI